MCHTHDIKLLSKFKWPRRCINIPEPGHDLQGGHAMNNITSIPFAYSKELFEFQQFLDWKAHHQVDIELTDLNKSSRDDRSESKFNEDSLRILLTPEEAAKRLSVGRTTVYELMGSGQLESMTIGRSRRIHTDALNEFVNRMRQGLTTDTISNTKVLSISPRHTGSNSQNSLLTTSARNSR